jgi:histidine triad (HIT) family protein
MAELTEEQLKNMSPEELREVQKQQCIFCQIISGAVASKRVYEDDRCVGILDINPANPGHVLVLPREHQAIMPMMSPADVAHLFKVAKKISKAQIRGLQADGSNIFAANGAAAGQKAPHFMLHVIPRKKGDGVTAFSFPKNQITPEDQAKLHAAIKMKVDEQFGIAEEKQVVAEKPEPEKVEATVGGAEEETAEEEQSREEGEAQEGEEPAEEDAGEEGAPKKGFDLDSISNMFK